LRRDSIFDAFGFLKIMLFVPFVFLARLGQPFVCLSRLAALVGRGCRRLLIPICQPPLTAPGVPTPLLATLALPFPPFYGERTFMRRKSPDIPFQSIEYPCSTLTLPHKDGNLLEGVVGMGFHLTSPALVQA
jgi:hypothetical protein